MARKRNQRNRQAKQYGNSIWQPLGGGYGGGYIDAFSGIREPTKAELIAAYEGSIYACSSIIANSIAETTLRLNVETKQGQARPKCRTAPIPTSRKSIAYHRKTEEVQEVVVHPLLDLIENPNEHHSSFDMLFMTESYLDMNGNAYWQIITGQHGYPVELKLLPSHLVQPIPHEIDVISGYRFASGNHQIIFQPEEIIHFRLPNLLNPYLDGYPPVRAIWEQNLLSKRELAYMSNVLNNSGRPEYLVAVKDDLGLVETDRLTKDLSQRYKGANAGGPLVISGAMTVAPLNWSNKDLGTIQLQDSLHTSICRAFGVPPALLPQGSNLAESTAARIVFYQNTLKPKLRRIQDVLNARLAPLFDERLYFTYDDTAPVDHQQEIAERAANLNEVSILLDREVISPTEAREKMGYEELPEETIVAEDDVNIPELAQSGSENGANSLRATVGGSQQIMLLAQAFYGGLLPRSACIGNAVILFGFSKEEAEQLFPEDVPTKLTADTNEPQAPMQPQTLAVKKEVKKTAAGHHGQSHSNEDRVAEVTAALDTTLPSKEKLNKCGGEGGKPGPCPEPGSGDSPASKPSSLTTPTGRGAATHEAIAKIIDKQPHLSAEQKTAYKDATAKVLSKMPDKAVERFGQNVGRVSFYADNKSLGLEVAKTAPSVADKIRAGQLQVNGAYTGSEKRLHLDGAATKSGDAIGEQARTNHHEVYAHEMTHGIDGGKFEHSGSPQWQAAFKDEIAGGQLSKYAVSKTYEGFAEFGRLVYGSDVDLKTVETKFPKCSAYFKEQGFFPHSSTKAYHHKAVTTLDDIFIDGIVDGETFVDFIASESKEKAFSQNKIKKVLQRFFGYQKAEVLKHVKGMKTAAGQSDESLSKDGTRPEVTAAVDSSLANKAVLVKSAPVPDIRQHENYTCGCAAAHSVCAAFGVGSGNEQDYIEALDTTKQDGTEPHAIKDFLQAQGLAVEDKHGMTLEDLATATDNQKPVIAAIQAYGTPNEEDQEKAGHYVVVTGITDTHVQCQDPSAGKTEVPHNDFVKSWHDVDKAGNEYKCYGIIVSKPKSKAYPVIDLSHWNDSLYAELLPLIKLFSDHGVFQTIQRFAGQGVDLTEMQPVVSAKINEAVEKATFQLCEATNETTSLDLTEAIKRVRQAIAEGTIQGDVRNELTARVSAIFDSASIERADTIASTESSRAINMSQLIVAKESGIVKGKRWILSSMPCPECQALGGKEVGLDEPFFQDDYSDGLAPPRHPKCLLPETPIFIPGTLNAMKAFYHAPCVRVVFSSGDAISVTPNHLFLTPDGFLRASNLVLGDDVVYCPVSKLVSFDIPNNQRQPTAINEVVATLAESSRVLRASMPVAPEDLHGDGTFCKGNVDIIFSNRSLPHKRKRQSINNELLASGGRGRQMLDTQSPITQLLKGLLPSSNRFMGISRDEQALLLGHARHADSLCFATSADRQPKQMQSLHNCSAAYAKNFRHCLNTFAGLIQTCKVVHIDWFSYHGNVYDLQNESTLNIVGTGIICSNCQCGWEEVLSDD